MSTGWLRHPIWLMVELKSLRADDAELKNAFVGAASSVSRFSTEHYEQLGYDEKQSLM
jgi:hypothetical protein